MTKLWTIICFCIPNIILSQLSYYQDIAPIMERHCTHCHQNNEVGPMSLTTYEEVASYASMIKFVTKSGYMPPFKANHTRVSYKNERTISDKDISIISEWIETGLLEGEKPTYPLNTAPKTPPTYDYSVCMDESFEHYGIYYDEYQAFVLPINNTEDLFIKQVILEPGNKKIVRSASISIANRGTANSADMWDPRYGFFAYGNLGFETALPNWYNWVPHTTGLPLDKEERLMIPKDSELIMHLHYGPYGETQSDSSCVHFLLSDDEKVTIQNIPLVNTGLLLDSFTLQAGQKNRISSSFYIPVDSYLKSVTPVAHLLCRSWEVFAVLPDKSSISLLSIADWDFNWKEKYMFKEPILLPQGTKIVTSASYDNSSNNPYNPSDPPHDMKKGPHMYDENFLCYFEMINKPSTAGTFKKIFTVATRKIEEINIQISEPNEYHITLHNLTDLSTLDLITKEYSIGAHTYRSSKLPSASGRYAFVLSNSDQVIDHWFFTIP